MTPPHENSESVISHALSALLSQIPRSEEPAATKPAERAADLARKAALKAAGVSASLALPAGPLGFATILPDLLAVWKIQQAMVADIAAIYDKTAALKPQTMAYCLFKHGGAALVRDLVTRSGQRFIIRQASIRGLHGILEKAGLRVTQQVVGRGVSRFVPLLGALAVGGYAYYDTTKVAATAIDLLSTDLALE